MSRSTSSAGTMQDAPLADWDRLNSGYDLDFSISSFSAALSSSSTSTGETGSGTAGWLYFAGWLGVMWANVYLWYAVFAFLLPKPGCTRAVLGIKFLSIT